MYKYMYVWLMEYISQKVETLGIFKDEGFGLEILGTIVQNIFFALIKKNLFNP